MRRVDRIGAALLLLSLLCVLTPHTAVADPPASDELEELDELLRAAPGDVDARAERALLLLLVGDASRALTDVEEAEAVAPEDGRWPLLRASCLVALNRLDDALVVLDDGAVARSTQPSAALSLRARIHVARGDDRAAVLDFDAALGGTHLDIDLFVLRAAALERLGRTEEALAGLAEGVALTGAAVLTDALVTALVRSGRTDEALARVDAASRVLPATRRGLLRTRILLALGDEDAARSTAADTVRLAEARALRRPSAARFIELASALALAGRCDEARARFEHARALSPGYASMDVPGIGPVAAQVHGCTERGAR